MSEASVSTPGELRLSSRVSEVSGVGPRRAEQFARLGVNTVADLVRFLPRAYEFHAAEGSVSDLTIDTIGSVRGTIVAARWVPGGRGKGRFQATLEDHTGRLNLVWFNATYLRQSLHAGTKVRVQGKVKAFGGYPQMSNPQWTVLNDDDEPPSREERWRPVYRASEDLPSKVIERVVAGVLPSVLSQVIDPLPAEMLKHHNMPALADAFRMAHLPAHEEESETARRRLAFNELLLLQLGIALKRHHVQAMLAAPALRWSEAIDKHIRERLPFALTESQNAVVKEIVADLRHEHPMNRLLQGDVGSGKTAVAVYAMLLATANRRQSAMMVPTELLAEQHFASISRMLTGSNVRVILLTGQGSGASADRERDLRRIEEGDADIVIGTQALLTESVRFNDLALVVVDEQHRFGVMQRAAFRERATAGESKLERRLSAPSPSGIGQGEGSAITPAKNDDKKSAKNTEPPPQPCPNGRGSQKQRSPHYLVMTATPIPRTLSLTIFGDLDVSTIRGLPPGRSPIVTKVVAPTKADDVYRYLAKRVAGGEQGYVVLPTIDGGGQESASQLKDVRSHIKLLEEKYLAGRKIAGVHGRLDRAEREAIMDRFRRGEISVLVATTVIEVGVDVPNATVMIVEHAERFGLAQLHQLRGRVGRGDHGKSSLCVFVAEPTTDEGKERMKAIAGTTDGFVIAEKDLEIRGMGEFFGTKQHGEPPLRVATIPGDMPLLTLARHDAESILREDATLHDARWTRLRKVLIQQYGDALGLIDVG